MAENYNNKLIVDFSGGVNLNAGRLLTGENQSLKIHNGILDKVGPITKTKGYLKRGADVNEGFDILGLAAAYKTDGTQKQIAIADSAASSDAYTYNSITNTWTPHLLSLTTGSKAEFEYFLDGFFMVNFTEETRFNNFTSWSTSTNVTNAPKARYIKLYLSRLYLGYVTYDGNTYSSRVVYSDLPTGGPLTLSWTNETNYFDVDSDDGDMIKGFGVNGNRLLIFKENALYRYDTNTLYKVPGCPGTVSQRSVANLHGATLYFHTSGIWLYDGTVSRMISRNISDLVEGISTSALQSVCAYAKGDHYYLYVGDVNNINQDISITKCLIDYDISKNAFTWKSLSLEPTVFSSYKDDRSSVTYNDATVTYNDSNVLYNAVTPSSLRVYFGATDGAVYEMERGNSWDGTDIDFVVETRDIYLNDPTSWKLLQKLHVLASGGEGMTIQFKLDDRDWKTLGKITKSQQELIFPDASRCQKVRFRISEMSSGEQFSLEGLDIRYTLEAAIV